MPTWCPRTPRTSTSRRSRCWSARTSPRRKRPSPTRPRRTGPRPTPPSPTRPSPTPPSPTPPSPTPPSPTRRRPAPPRPPMAPTSRRRPPIDAEPAEPEEDQLGDDFETRLARDLVASFPNAQRDELLKGAKALMATASSEPGGGAHHGAGRHRRRLGGARRWRPHRRDARGRARHRRCQPGQGRRRRHPHRDRDQPRHRPGVPDHRAGAVRRRSVPRPRAAVRQDRRRASAGASRPTRIKVPEGHRRPARPSSALEVQARRKHAPATVIRDHAARSRRCRRRCSPTPTTWSTTATATAWSSRARSTGSRLTMQEQRQGAATETTALLAQRLGRRRGASTSRASSWVSSRSGETQAPSSSRSS
jgi:hypothetical protein